MRLVRYAPQERVDLPDITAMSFLVLGEFRRTVRGLVLGPSAGSATHDNYIVRGFAAEASSPADNLVNVRLVPSTGGGRPLAFAVGAEDLSTRMDHGQVIGGEDIAGNTEGNALATLDLTGQPADTYRLQMRFVYQDGVNDNRAFWDAGSNTEFIAATDTRHLPVVELGIAVSPASLGDDYIPIADLFWDGVGPLNTGDIVDRRPFLLEGTAGDFRSTSQTSFSGYPDFDRSTDRANNGQHEIAPFVRLLGRQIADLKGQADDGQFDVFSRVVPPYDPGGAFNAEQTKSLRTIDTVTYTVGDSSTDWGDVNNALNFLLSTIAAMGANTPSHIHIVLKSKASAPHTFTVSDSHTFNANLDRLTIDCGGQIVNFTHTAGTTSISGGGSDFFLRMFNADQINVTTNATIADCQVEFWQINRLTGSTADPSDALLRLRGDSYLHDIGFVEGKVGIAASTTAEAVDDEIESLGVVRISNCRISGVIAMEAATDAFASTVLHLDNCEVSNTRTHCLGETEVLGGAGNSLLSVTNCIFGWNPEYDCIRWGTVTGHVPHGISIKGCTFRNMITPTTGGDYAISLISSQYAIIEGNYFHFWDPDTGGIELNGADHVVISNNRFNGTGVTGRPSTVCALRITNPGEDISIVNNIFQGFEPNDAGADDGRVIRGSGTANIDSMVISGNQFLSNGGYCIDFDDGGVYDAVNIVGNVVRVPEANGRGFSVGNGFANGSISNNVMLFTTAATNGIVMGTGGDAVCSGNRLNNGTISTGGGVLYGFSGGGGPTNLNYVT